MATRAIVIMVASAVVASVAAGCATNPVPVQVVADSFCLAAKKRTWSVNDTQETIDEAIRHNAGIDKACGKKREGKVS